MTPRSTTKNIWIRILQKLESSEEGTTASAIAKEVGLDVQHIGWRIDRLVDSRILMTDGDRIWPNTEHFIFASESESVEPSFWHSINWAEIIVGWFLGQVSFYPIMVILGML